MNVARFFRTVRHLKLRQVSDRIARRVIRTRPKRGPAEPLRASLQPAAAFVLRPACWDGGTRFDLLGVAHEIAGPQGWNQAAEKLWLYHVHYFEDLLRPDADSWRCNHQRLIKRWIEENPPAKGNGWEPYPISIRVSNWIKWVVGGATCPQDMCDSLALQLRQLAGALEYHLLGNHLWANAKALFLGGLFFEGPEADRWRKRGFRILMQQFSEQILADGGHFERSPTYHALILEDVLDLLNIAACYGAELPAAWACKAQAMMCWLECMTRPDGRPVLWNDAAGNAHPTFAELQGYMSRLGLPASAEKVRILYETGYARMDQGRGTLWFDAAAIGPDYIPGHAHADSLNIELFVAGGPILTDTGVSTYSIGERRAFERSTRAHNSVELAKTDSSELWAGFRVGRRARPRDVYLTPDRFSAAHDGYDHLGARHSRQILRAANGFRIVDKVRRRKPLAQAAYFHLAPGLKVAIKDTAVTVEDVQLEFDGALSIDIEPYQLAAGFNRLVDAISLRVSFDGELTTTIKF